MCVCVRGVMGDILGRASRITARNGGARRQRNEIAALGAGVGFVLMGRFRSRAVDNRKRETGGRGKSPVASDDQPTLSAVLAG